MDIGSNVTNNQALTCDDGTLIEQQDSDHVNLWLVAFPNVDQNFWIAGENLTVA